MKICENVYQLKINFSITPDIKRYVYVYIIEGREGYYLIDTGVKGSQKKIMEFIHNLGKKRDNINAVLLTHSHPDHMGSVKSIKKEWGCPVYASKGERKWIEDIDCQYKERPIPGFYQLVEGPVAVDRLVGNSDRISLEPDITIRVYETAGHSQESLSFYYQEKGIMFTGDAIPAPGDVLVYEDSFTSLRTLKHLADLEDVKSFCPAWDRWYDSIEGKSVINSGIQRIQEIRSCMEKYWLENQILEPEELFTHIRKETGRPELQNNPLFIRSVMSDLKRLKV